MFLRETTPSPGQVRRELKKGAVAGGTRHQIWQTSFFDRNRWYQCHLDKLNKRVVRGSRGAVKRFAASPVISARMQMYGHPGSLTSHETKVAKCVVTISWARAASATDNAIKIYAGQLSPAPSGS